MNKKEFEAKRIYSEGSGVCAIVDDKISMKLNEYGIYEETICTDEDVELSPLIEYVSPNFNQEVDESMIADQLFSQIKDIQFDKRVGYYLSLYAGHVSEEDYRAKASSGGLGTWILKELLERNLVDGVIHVKENEDKTSPVLFEYGISRTIEEIRDGAKTKYYPVELSKVIKKVKEQPGRYAIVGIPSFIMAVRLLSQKDPIVKERIKFTIGLICGHQKSSKFSESIAWQVGIKPGDLKYIDFRKKLLDKPANNYGVSMTGIVNGELVSIVKPTKELLGQNWGQGYFKVHASDFTDDVMNETADITLGDAWLPEYTKDSLGNNVTVIRNPHIELIIQEGIASGKLTFDAVSVNTIVKSQIAHYRHTYDELPYRLFKRQRSNEWYPKKRVEPSNKIPYLRKKVQDLRMELSVQSHYVYKKAVETDDLSYYITEMSKLSDEYNRLYKFISAQSKLKRRIARVIKIIRR